MRILQPGTNPDTADHYLYCTPETVTWGTLPTPESTPILTIDSGDTVTFDTVSQEGLMEDQGRDPVAYFAEYGVPRSDVLRDGIELAASDLRRANVPPGPHVVLGPVHVRRAQPGDWLRVEFLDFAPRVPYGVISSRHGRGALPDLYPRDPSNATVSVFSRFCPLDTTNNRADFPYRTGTLPIPFRPFTGLCGVTPSDPTPRGTIEPGTFGGNMDLREISSGSVLYLPVQSEGAGFYLGDPHFAQGNGEIALTALEGSLRVTARLSLCRPASGAHQPLPFAETSTHWIVLGLHVDLNEAMQQCAQNAVDFVANHTGMPPSEAYLYLSAAGDFSVTQVVDMVKGVHCSIPKL